MFQSKFALLNSQQGLNSHSKFLGGNIPIRSSEFSIVSASTQF